MAMFSEKPRNLVKNVSNSSKTFDIILLLVKTKHKLTLTLYKENTESVNELDTEKPIKALKIWTLTDHICFSWL